MFGKFLKWGRGHACKIEEGPFFCFEKYLQPSKVQKGWDPVGGKRFIKKGCSKLYIYMPFEKIVETKENHKQNSGPAMRLKEDR